VLARLGKNRARAAPWRGALWSFRSRLPLHRGPACKTPRELRIIRCECAQLGQHRLARCAASLGDQGRLADTLTCWIGSSLDLQPRDDFAWITLVDRNDDDAPARRVVSVDREAVLHRENMRARRGSRKADCGLRIDYMHAIRNPHIRFAWFSSVHGPISRDR
jgi:hypothetical protein